MVGPPYILYTHFAFLDILERNAPADYPKQPYGLRKDKSRGEGEGRRRREKSISFLEHIFQRGMFSTTRKEWLKENGYHEKTY